MINLYGVSLPHLEEMMVNEGQNKYRARQLYSWIYEKGETDFEKMTDISKKFIEVLKEKYCLVKPTIYQKQVSEDGTIKLLVEFADHAKVETVLMRYNYGLAACVSSEVGCNMGCKFCASGLLKKQRNLAPEEMVGEILLLNDLLKEEGKRVTHVVVMGTGEPFDNYDNVIEFIKVINEQRGLAISLHASNDELRNQLMPINKAYPLKELIAAVKEYNVVASRRVTFEYILLKGVNDSLKDAEELARLIRPVFAYVNLIPYNEVDENGFHRSENSKKFMDYLMKHGVNATIRKEFGSDIDAACGQLRAKNEGRL